MAVTMSVSCTQNSQSIANNTSNITVKAILKWGGGSWNGNKQPGSITVNGTTYSFNKSFNTAQAYSGSVTIHSVTVNVKHNTDGKKTVSYSAKYDTDLSSGVVSASGSKTLTTIPRQATLSSAPNFNDETNPKITYSNPAGTAVTTLQAGIFTSDGGASFAPYRDISKSSTSLTFNLSEAISSGTVRDKLLKTCNTSNSMSIRFYVKTIIGGNTYRSYLTKTFSVVNANPTLQPVISDIGGASQQLTGGNPDVIIKGFNYTTCSYNAAPLKHAELTGLKVVSGSKNKTETRTVGSDVVLPTASVLENVDSGTFVVTVTDSRGNSSTQTIEKTFVDYIPLTCQFINGKPTADGEMLFTIAGNYFNGCFGEPGVAQDNSLLVQWRMKKIEPVIDEETGEQISDGEYGEWTTVEPTITDNTYAYTETITGLDYQSTYSFQARAQDKLNEVNGKFIETSEIKVKCQPLFDWNDEDFTFNIPVNANNGMTVTNDINTNSLIAENTLMVRGHTVHTKWDRVSVALTNTPSGSSYTCYYYPSIGICFLRMYLTGIAMSANTAYNVGLVSENNYGTSMMHALSVYGLQDYAYSEKARISSDHYITIIPTCAKSASDDLYITGWWYARVG